MGNLSIKYFLAVFSLVLITGCSNSGDSVGNHSPNGSVTISGITTEKETLTASNTLTDEDGLGTISYQWKRNDSNISGATGQTYTLAPVDNDAIITVTASYTDQRGTAESIDSAATAAISRVHDVMALFSNSDMFYNTSIDFASSWQGATSFEANGSSSAPWHYDLDGVSDGKGNIISVWGAEAVDGTDIDIVYKRSLDNGATWSVMTTLNSEASIDSGEDEHPSISTNGNGRWITVWGGPNNDSGTGDDIFYSVSDDNGTSWTAQIELNAATEAFNDWDPVITNDGGNNWLIVWQSGNDLSGTIGSDSDLLYSYSSDNGQTWSSTAAVDSRALSDSVGDTWPDVAMDSAGKAILIWNSSNDLSATIGSDSDIFVSTSSDYGVTWSTSAVLNDNAATDTGSDIYAKVALDEAGNSVVVWDSNEDLNSTAGTDIDIFVSRSNDYGATWSTPTTLNSDALIDSDHDRYPAIVGDGAGSWAVSWDDRPTSFSSAISNDNGQTWSTLINLDDGISSSNFGYSTLIVY